MNRTDDKAVTVLRPSRGEFWVQGIITLLVLTLLLVLGKVKPLYPFNALFIVLAVLIVVLGHLSPTCEVRNYVSKFYPWLISLCLALILSPRSMERYAKLEVVFFSRGPAQGSTPCSRYLHVLRDASESETMVVDIGVFNFGDEVAKNILVTADFALASFQYARGEHVSQVDTVTHQHEFDDIQAPTPEKYLRLSWKLHLNEVVTQGLLFQVGKVTFVTKRPLVFRWLTEPAFDFEIVPTTVRYENSLNKKGPKEGCLAIVSPAASEQTRKRGASKLMDANHAVAEGKGKSVSTTSLFK